MKNELDLTTLAAEMSAIIDAIEAIKVQRERDNIQSRLSLLKKKYHSPRSIAEISFFSENTSCEVSELMESFNDGMGQQAAPLTPPKRSVSPLVIRPIRTSVDMSVNECRTPIDRPSPKQSEKTKSPVKETMSPYSKIGPR
jgi:hypothetical protein